MSIATFDPSKNREGRYRSAKRRAAVMTPERLTELHERYPDAHPPAATKKSRASIPTYGTMDAVSVQISNDPGAEPYMTGESNDFLFPSGSGQTFNEDGRLPRQLRQNGWVYLRAGDQLVARVQFTGIEHRERRVEHVSSPEGHLNRGAGLVLAVDRDTWEECSHRLGSRRESGNGYRYYMLDGDDLVWTRTSR